MGLHGKKPWYCTLNLTVKRGQALDRRRYQKATTNEVVSPKHHPSSVETQLYLCRD
jgi:hypothetical protein